MVREPDATSSRVSHFGQTMSLERAAESDAQISVLQCGQIRTATSHLQSQAPTIIEIAAKGNGKCGGNLSCAQEMSWLRFPTG